MPDPTPPSSNATSPTPAAAVAPVVPRAEFRVFGHGIVAGVEARLWSAGDVRLESRRASRESYLVSRHTSAVNVKVRDGRLEVKLKTGETPEGYEIFTPFGKHPFPVRREDLAAILERLGAVSALDQDRYGLDEVLELARRDPALVLVDVAKVRSGFTVGGVLCEVARVYFNGALLESACVESADPAAVRRVVEALGLGTRENVGYVRAARRVVGLEALAGGPSEAP